MFRKDIVIDEYDISGDIINLLGISNIDEIKYVSTSIFNCLNFLIQNKKIKLSKSFNDGIVNRGGLLKSGNALDGFFPMAKSIVSNCGVEHSPNEAIWFSKNFLNRYMTDGMNVDNPYGLKSCRKLKNIDSNDNSLLVFINLSSTTIHDCSKARGEKSVLLSKNIQTHFNNCILHAIVRSYSTKYTNNNYPNEIKYTDIIHYKDTIILDLIVAGYQCDPKYNFPCTIHDILISWNYETGARLSVYNPDRIQIDILFRLFELMNNILLINGTSIINESYLELNPKLNFIKILGWTCEDTPRQVDCSLFPGEITIALKYLKKPVRYGIFEPQDESCKMRIYKLINTQNGSKNMEEVSKDDPSIIQYCSRYNGGAKKNTNIIINDFNEMKEMKTDLRYKELELELELSPEDLNINQLFVPSSEEEKEYTFEDKKISDFFSKIIEKEKISDEKESDYEKSTGGTKYKSKKKTKKYTSKKKTKKYTSKKKTKKYKFKKNTNKVNLRRRQTN
jgi:hypothetical protein